MKSYDQGIIKTILPFKNKNEAQKSYIMWQNKIYNNLSVHGDASDFLETSLTDYNRILCNYNISKKMSGFFFGLFFCAL